MSFKLSLAKLEVAPRSPRLWLVCRGVQSTSRAVQEVVPVHNKGGEGGKAQPFRSSFC